VERDNEVFAVASDHYLSPRPPKRAIGNFSHYRHATLPHTHHVNEASYLWFCFRQEDLMEAVDKERSDKRFAGKGQITIRRALKAFYGLHAQVPADTAPTTIILRQGSPDPLQLELAHLLELLGVFDRGLICYRPTHHCCSGNPINAKFT
jgi:hypothetical protein